MNIILIGTTNEGNIEYLNITSVIRGKKCVLKKLHALSSGLYYMSIRIIEIYAVLNQNITDEFNVWHDRLGHPGSIMMQNIIENSCGHSIKKKKGFTIR